MLEIIYVETPMWRDVLLLMLDYFLFLMLLTVVGALLSSQRTTMYWFVMMSGICALLAVLALTFLTGSGFLLFAGILFAFVLPISYFRQKKIIMGEEAEKGRLYKLEKRMKEKQITEKAMEKISKENPTRFMPKSAE